MGLTESLIEAYKCVQLYNLSNPSWKEPGKHSKEAIEKEMASIIQRSLKLHFPISRKDLFSNFDFQKSNINHCN